MGFISVSVGVVRINSTRARGWISMLLLLRNSTFHVEIIRKNCSRKIRRALTWLVAKQCSVRLQKTAPLKSMPNSIFNPRKVAHTATKSSWYLKSQGNFHLFELEFTEIFYEFTRLKFVTDFHFPPLDANDCEKTHTKCKFRPQNGNWYEIKCNNINEEGEHESRGR